MKKRMVKLTESDLERIVKRVIKENEEEYDIHSNTVGDDLKNYATFDKDSYRKGELGSGFNKEQYDLFATTMMDFLRQAQDTIEDPYVEEVVNRLLINAFSIGKQKFRRR